MKITLTPNLTRENAYETTKKLCAALDLLKIEYNFYNNKTLGDAFSDCTRIEEDELKDNADLLIAIGGDGTMIRAAKIALPYDIPILGINAGNLAFLMGLETDEIKLLNKLLTNNYYIEERLVIKLDLFNENGENVVTDYCINDTVFARGAEIKPSSFDLFCNDRFVNRYTADGLIIATPTGSTAYNLSAGGPIVDPSVESIIFSPICPHSLAERSVIFSSDSVIKVSNPENNTAQLFLSCDGRDSYSFNKNWYAELRKAEKKVKFIRLKDDSFMDILHKKMKYSNK